MRDDEAVRQITEADHARTDAWTIYQAECVKMDKTRLERALEYIEKCRKYLRKALNKVDRDG